MTMKKVYSKPVIIYDDFRLSANIAAGCEVRSNHAMNECTFDLGPGVPPPFANGLSICEYTPEDGTYNGACYDVPSTDNNLFTS